MATRETFSPKQDPKPRANLLGVENGDSAKRVRPNRDRVVLSLVNQSLRKEKTKKRQKNRCKVTMPIFSRVPATPLQGLGKEYSLLSP